MLPVFVFTGFLGSGKTTTLLNCAREHFSNRRTAVIVNELGEVGVDGKLLKNAYSEVLELPEGCICCTLHAEFERAIGEIREKYDPEVLLVETSGGAVPFPVVISLQSLGFSVEAVICLIDSKNFDRYREDSTARYQIGGSNVLVLNKSDLVSEERLVELEREALDIWNLYRPVNAFTGEPYYTKVKVYKTSYGRLPSEVFEGSYTLPELRGLVEHPSHGFKHRVANLLTPVDYEELVQRLRSLPEKVIRAKGIVRLKNHPYPVIINYSFGHIDSPIEIKDYDGPSFLVLIESL